MYMTMLDYGLINFPRDVNLVNTPKSSRIIKWMEHILPQQFENNAMHALPLTGLLCCIELAEPDQTYWTFVMELFPACMGAARLNRPANLFTITGSFWSIYPGKTWLNLLNVGDKAHKSTHRSIPLKWLMEVFAPVVWSIPRHQTWPNLGESNWTYCTSVMMPLPVHIGTSHVSGWCMYLH